MFCSFTARCKSHTSDREPGVSSSSLPSFPTPRVKSILPDINAFQLTKNGPLKIYTLKCSISLIYCISCCPKNRFLKIKQPQFFPSIYRLVKIMLPLKITLPLKTTLPLKHTTLSLKITLPFKPFQFIPIIQKQFQVTCYEYDRKTNI